MNKEIVIQPEIKYIVIGYEVIYTIDNPVDKTVKTKVNLLSQDGQKYDYNEILLWEGENYDNIGQWTDTDLQNRLIELLNS